MLNKKIDTWTIIGEFPEPGKPVWILIEHDVVHDEDVEAPFTRKAETRIEDFAGRPFISWHLLDFDPETEDEILHQDMTVVAWRYV